MGSSPFLPFFLTLLLLLHNHGFPLVKAYVEETCRSAAKSDARVNYDYCVNRLYRHHDSTDADTWRLAQIAADLSVNNSEVATYEIKSLMKKLASDPVMVSLLKGCLTLFANMGTDQAKAETEIAWRHYNPAIELLNQAIVMAQACDTSFSKAGKQSLLTPWNSEAINLSILSIAITNLLTQCSLN